MFLRGLETLEMRVEADQEPKQVDSVYSLFAGANKAEPLAHRNSQPMNHLFNTLINEEDEDQEVWQTPEEPNHPREAQ